MAIVKTINAGSVNYFLVREEGIVLVDTGTPGQHNNFLKQLKQLKLNPLDVQLIIITHGHGDHFGSAQQIKEITGGKIAVHQKDANVVREGRKVFPPGLNGWGRFLSFVWRPILSLVNYPAIEPDVIIENALSLSGFGINGQVIHTPGHTAGSVSVVLDSGEAIVGDVAMNGFPMRWGAGLPIFGDSEKEIRQSWKKLLDAGACIIYPGHGVPFPASQLK